jgi:sporulation protein YlmC with PRC-barrel domain
MKLSKITLSVSMAAMAGVLASTSIAQQNQNDQQKQSDQQKQNQQRYQQPNQSGVDRNTTPSAQAWNKPTQAVKASEVIGKEIQGALGKEIGEINDLLIDLPQGRIAGVVIGVGGILGVGEKDRVVPPQAIECQGKDHADYSATDRSKNVTDAQERNRTENQPNSARAKDRSEDSVLVLKMDEKLKTAKTTEQDLNSCERLGQVYRDYQQSPYWNGNNDKSRQPVRQQDRETTGAKMTSFQVKKAQELIGAEVKGQANKNVGELQDFVVDLQSGRILYATMTVGGTAGIGGDLVAVPPRQFAMHTDGNLMLNTTEERLKNAPRLDKNQSELSDPSWVSKVYGYYGETQDWNSEPNTSKSYQNKNSLENDQREVREEKQNEDR